jgi:hypothetical protein
MGYIEDYFYKQPGDIKEADINSFIAQRIQENLTLDYKDFQKFDDPIGLSMQISSFANSVGGLLILGISESDNWPIAITWGNLNIKTRESLENKLRSQIYPKFDGLKIVPVYQNGSQEIGIYLIEIPQGDNPPYMAGDKKYYKRLNFQKQPMEGYEVSDYFGRRKRPKLSLEIKNHFKIRSFTENPRILNWHVYVKNIGKTVVREFFCRIRSTDSKIISAGHPFQTEKEQGGKISVKGIFSDPQKYILLPHPTEQTFLGIIDFEVTFPETGPIQKVSIEYELLAENMPIIKGNFSWSVNITNFAILLDTDPREEEISNW